MRAGSRSGAPSGLLLELIEPLLLLGGQLAEAPKVLGHLTVRVNRPDAVRWFAAKGKARDNGARLVMVAAACTFALTHKALDARVLGRHQYAWYPDISGGEALDEVVDVNAVA